tara:strand:- start:173 stop:433 length:261 start_codon:yes stop_codon:yes gene_type:complete
MGRKSSRVSYTSKGERRNSSRKTIKMMRRERTFSERLDAQFAAFQKDKNVILTVPNPSKSATNKPFIKVPASDYWRLSKNDKSKTS